MDSCVNSETHSHSAITKITRVLIANRGAIAVRIIRTLREMGIESVAIYAEVDRESLHVRQADHAFSLGEGVARDTYLNQKKIFAIAKEAGAQAIHPGYGFLSENTEFVENCAERGLVFLGPRPEQIEAFGLKHRARALAEDNSVPLLPGTAVLKDQSEAMTEAEKIGYPVMLKSSAGGGGIGMQLCHNAEELSRVYASVAELSQNNFANSALFLEKFVQRARHIEVQIFGDGQGGAIALGERDCSAQRRNQKVLEETPAPNLATQTRQSLQQIATRLVSSVNYQSAGTVEFILDADTEEFYFLEVNTRLQVEHGVTEEIYGVDIVRWMLELARGELAPLAALEETLSPKGHAIQARVYAEDPARDFQPCAGLLSDVQLPENQPNHLRADHWIEAGIEVSPFFDPMLAKVIAVADTREASISALRKALEESRIYGIETNLGYLTELLEHVPITQGNCLTSTLASFRYQSNAVEVLNAGTMTTVQDYPGRQGYWDIGVPPSGPFDSYSFRLGNRLLGNEESAAGLEMTVNGASLRFRSATQILLAGAEMDATLDGEAIQYWCVHRVLSGQELHIGKLTGSGARSYLLVKGGIQCPEYLGSKSTFTLGQFGGHAGRALRLGDVLHIAGPVEETTDQNHHSGSVPTIANRWQIHVTSGPQSAPDYFTEAYMQSFYDADWEVHYNSSRTGVRLIGPKPEWAREDGGEAGMHPSNLHDNPYAIGAIDFTGDMPVILGPDGPSLGGFVCPAVVATADLWKLGQLRAGDKIRFVPIELESAINQIRANNALIAGAPAAELVPVVSLNTGPQVSYLSAGETEVRVLQGGDSYMLIEFGEHLLDIRLRFLVHRLMLQLQEIRLQGVLDLTPGIRSLQVHYDPLQLDVSSLLERIEKALADIAHAKNQTVPSRIVHIPLSWDDPVCGEAIEKYQKSVRENAPWYPSNIEFIRRINGLDSVEQVKDILFSARYLVMGLGDVYLGAPVATPVDPRHRLVTTKYNPARTWTAENSVGIGGAYLCIYGMEGPGGYQFVGRTLQMWNRYRQTREFERPWLLRFFDQIQFYPVSSDDLEQIRRDFPIGNYPIRVEETEFSLDAYEAFIETNHSGIDDFVGRREAAFAAELDHWKASGQFHFESEQGEAAEDSDGPPEGMVAVDSPVAGNVWKLNVEEGDRVQAGDCLMVLESMKMEIEVCAAESGRVNRVFCAAGSQVDAGQSIVFLNPNE